MGEVAYECLIHHEAFASARRWGCRAAASSKAGHQLRHALLCAGQEVGEFDFLSLDAIDSGENDLKRALEELYFAGRVEEISGVEAACDVLAGVP